VRGVPPDATADLVGRFGLLRRTMYSDGVWDTTPRDHEGDADADDGSEGGSETGVKDAPPHEEQYSTTVVDTAYTNQELLPHTDCTYYRDPPALQVFHCVQASSDGGGGATWLADGFAVAAELQAKHPRSFAFFARQPLPFHCLESAPPSGLGVPPPLGKGLGVHVEAVARVLDLVDDFGGEVEAVHRGAANSGAHSGGGRGALSGGGGGDVNWGECGGSGGGGEGDARRQQPQRIRKFRYNNDDRAPLRQELFRPPPPLENTKHPTDPCHDRNSSPALSSSAAASSGFEETMSALYASHLPNLLRATQSSSLALELRLQEGDALVLCNHRVLHGRRAFEGKGRNLSGAYLGLDEFESACRCLGLPHDIAAELPLPPTTKAEKTGAEVNGRTTEEHTARVSHEQRTNNGTSFDASLSLNGQRE